MNRAGLALVSLVTLSLLADGCSGSPPPDPEELYAEVVIPGNTSQILRELAPLDADGKLDDDELEVIETVGWIRDEMMPEEIHSGYYGDGIHLAPYQQHFLQPLLEDGEVSEQEVEAFRALTDPSVWSRWYVVRDIFGSSMIGDGPLEEDWDEDGLSNIDEIRAGTNPLNDLETDPNDPSERFMILMNGSNEDASWFPSAANILYTYHAARKFGYKDREIALLLQTNDSPLDLTPESRAIWEELLVAESPSLAGDPAGLDAAMEEIQRVWREAFGDYPHEILQPAAWEGFLDGRDLLHEPMEPVVDYRDFEVTTEAFREAISSLPSDGNDLVTIIYAGHGNTRNLYLKPNEFLFPSQVSEALEGVSYGRFLWISLASLNSAFVERLAPEGDAILVAANWEDESPGTNPAWLVEVMFKLEVGSPMKLAGAGTRNPGGAGSWRVDDRYYLWSIEAGEEVGFFSGRSTEAGGGEYGDLRAADWLSPLMYIRKR